MSVGKSRKAKKEKTEIEPDLRDIYYFAAPHLVTGVLEKQISKVFAKGCYCYALSEANNELYSWGIGENYVLGLKNHDDNAYEPTLVHPMQFHNNKVKQVGPGIQHVVVLTTASTEDQKLPEFDMNVLDLPAVPIEEEEEEKKNEEPVEEEEEKKEPPVVNKT